MQIGTHLDNILSLLTQSPVVLVSAPSGYGTLGGISAALGSRGSRVFVSVDSPVSAQSLVAYQNMISPTVETGIAVTSREEPLLNSITYGTSPYLREKLLSTFENGRAQAIFFADVLILNNAASGSMDTSVNLDLWKYAARQGVRVPRLILVVDTVDDRSHLLKMFEGFLRPAIYEVHAEGFAIEIRYAQRDYDPSDPDLYRDTAKLATQVYAREGTDSMLIYAPGSGEAETITSILTSASLPFAMILPAYGKMIEKNFSLIYEEAPENYRKIIITTAETQETITLDDIGIVIDTMAEQKREVSASGGPRIVTGYVSKSVAESRTNRTGRKDQGVSYRMMTLDRFDSLRKEPLWEIDRFPLDRVVLDLLSVGLDPLDVLSHVDSSRITKSQHLMTSLGLIESSRPTKAAAFVVQFPLSVRNATVLEKWKSLNKPMFPAVAAMAMVDSFLPLYFSYPRKAIDQTLTDYRNFLANYQKTYFNRFRGRSDVDTFLNIWNDLMETLGGLEYNEADLTLWCQQNSMNRRKIQEALTIAQKSMEVCRKETVNCKEGSFDREEVMSFLRPILASVYADKMMILQKKEEQISYLHHFTEYLIDTSQSFNTFLINPPAFLVALLTSEYDLEYVDEAIAVSMAPLHLILIGVDIDRPVDRSSEIRRASTPGQVPRRATPRKERKD